MAEITYEVAALYDGGWRSTDKEDLIKEYNLSEAQANEICEGLKELEK